MTDHCKLGVLIDPEKATGKNFDKLLSYLNLPIINKILVGGSTYTSGNIDQLIQRIRPHTSRPIWGFPGSPAQLSYYFEGALLPSLFSGSSFEYCVGTHIKHMDQIASYDYPIHPTAYVLIDTGHYSMTAQVTQTTPIPQDDITKVINIGRFAAMVGYQALYLEGGSGTNKSMSLDFIQQVKQNITIPLYIGGGVQCSEYFFQLINLGVDMVIIGNAFENNPSLLHDIQYQHSHSTI